ncbi:hypothetical protein ACM5Q9_05875 [Advenella sp. RU8]|uniref:hypothetical protein n=1 Tax=Advenella sp. RU8 TaxID=3399575 RepID=UPI003AB0FEC1
MHSASAQEQPPAQPDGGWQALADILKKLEPSVDTSIPETPVQASLRINQLITSGKFQQALNEIEKIQPTVSYMEQPGTDVQLRFLRARALTGLGKTDAAISVYQDMTSKYPELAEPWNNMATLQLKAGLLDQAYESLKMAITINPKYGIAHRNMGLVQLIMANHSFDQAVKNGVTSAATQAAAIKRIVNGN